MTVTALPLHRFTRRMALAACAAACAAAGAPAFAQGPPDVGALLAAQRKAMAPLAAFDGTWRGPATISMPGGTTLKLIQTERFGPMLDGTLRVVEGRGHEASGAVAFNALGIISFDVPSGRYRFRSYARGHQGDFPIEVQDGAFVWEMPAGPAIVRYTASVKDGVWSETGELRIPDKPPQRIFEMRLQRVGDTDWPAGGAINP